MNMVRVSITNQLKIKNFCQKSDPLPPKNNTLFFEKEEKNEKEAENEHFSQSGAPLPQLICIIERKKLCVLGF